MNIETLTAILIDDESFAIANLTKLIETYCSSIKIIGSSTQVKTGEELILQLKPDVVFLDINMPLLNGFELLDRLTYLPYVVFVTAHESYALMAMKVCAVDFILKPISIPELVATQKKLLQIHTIKPEIQRNYSLVLRNLGALIENREQVRKLTVHGLDGYQIFDMDDIIYLSGEDNYTNIHFTNQKSLLVSKTLKEYEQFLVQFGFMRVHKSSLVNLKHIKKLVQSESPEVILLKDFKVLVSRRKLPELLDWCKAHLT